MAKNRTMAQKNLVNKKRQGEERKKKLMLTLSTNQYMKYDSKMSDFDRARMRFTDMHDAKFVIYIDSYDNVQHIIEKEYLETLKSIRKIKVIGYK